jgi:rhomboid protease GluP
MSSQLGLLYELVLISVVIGGGYWGWFFITRQPHGTPTYGLMQLAAAALSGLGLYGRHGGGSALGAAGAIGAGAGTCLLILGPLVRTAARRFAAAERFGIANHLLTLADALAPGSGVGEEKALLAAMREIRDGKIEPTLDALSAAKERAPAEARLAIDERIAMLYLAAYRWDDAITHAEKNLFGSVQPETPTNPATALRRALGIAPPVYVELLGAYARKGDLDQAAKMLARLEDVCVGRDDAAIWLHRGRLMFLALAGRVPAVQALVAPRKSRHMNAASRTYWLAVAHERHGEAKAAEAAYARARSRSRGRPRDLIDQALANLMNAKVAELSPLATEVIARVEAGPVPVVVERTQRGPWGTRLLLAVLSAVAVVVMLGVGSSVDVGVLTRSGAMVRGLVRAGEWWRLVTCTFLHVGGVHLVLNLLGLYFVGRIAEDIFGPWRMLAIYALAGIAGSVASYVASPAGISAGASGAIFGLLGALLLELTLHRRRHRSAWNRGMLGSIAVVSVAQLGLGFLYPMMDQWAHGGGLAMGALAALALSPNARWSVLGHHAARILAIASGFASVAAAVLCVRTSLADSLTLGPTKTFELGRVRVTAPATWQASDDSLAEPDLVINLHVDRQVTTRFDMQLEAFVAGEPERIGATPDQIVVADDRAFDLPPDWQGKEMVLSIPDPMGTQQHFRALIASRTTGRETIFTSLYVPETVARAARPFFTKILASIE